MGVVALVCAACGHNALMPDAAGADAPIGPPIDAPADAAYGTSMVDVEGDITGVHDPAIVSSGTNYYIYSTGEGLPIRQSPDLVHWRVIGSVFAQKPSWITTTATNDPNALWAPDVSYFGGQYHLFYAASTFGSNTSCIGHATSPTLDGAVWTDQGKEVICSASTDDWNALDPAAFVDQDGNVWLALGSFWSGLKLISLDSTGARQGTAFYALATRTNTADEASYLVHHGDYYYLFESVDFCCRGVDSTYKIMVGRSTDITGPYVDQTGTPLLSDGGMLVLQGNDRWKGPGHNSILHTAAGDYNVYHSYDAQANGEPTLRIAQMTWSSDGWPVSAGP
ncbi:MAG TPA: arabinan endo-1,5-alpha-L-arabinosidase [Kofleriaceae bacterium]|nr:arabinan endo-1,5-alpha-L-arabinosidase [Kofleriaceae bacterium]